ncbi:GNAT family N-acetyltransferase [Arthrobacter monumenti]
MSVLLRAVTDADIPAITVINNSAVPAVPTTDEDGIAALVDGAALKLVAVPDENRAAVIGFVFAFSAGSPYDSENFQWFEKRGGSHFYVDRIVVADGARGRGVGESLYAAVFDHAWSIGADSVTCEVNTDPPNPGSLKFHGRLGFTEVGSQPTKGGTVTVAMLEHRPQRT